MGVMAPRSSCPGEDANPLQGAGRHPVQHETKTFILSHLYAWLVRSLSFSPALRARQVASSGSVSLPCCGS